MTIAESQDTPAGTVATYEHFVVKDEDYDRVRRSLPDKEAVSRDLHMRRQGLKWTGGDGVSIVEDSAAGVLYQIDARGQFVVALGRSRPTNVKDLARQTRELLLRELFEDGWITVHAASIKGPDGVVLFAGKKGAGKTSLMVSALSRGGCSYVSNDRVLLKARDGGVEIAPYPMSVRLGGGTLRNHPILRSHLHAYDHLDAALLPLEAQYVHPDKVELAAREFTQILGVQQSFEGSVARIVFPAVDFKATAANIEQAARGRIAQELNDALLLPDPDGSGWLREELGLANRASPEALEALINALESKAVIAAGGMSQILESVVPRVSPGEGIGSWKRARVEAVVCAVMNHDRHDRGLRLAEWQTRAVRQGDVHEILLVGPESVNPSEPIDNVSYIGFATFEAGLLAVGDEVCIDDHLVGTVAGFDDTHLPNHMNICLRGELENGVSRGLKPGSTVKFRGGSS
jgi:hypothetical protein